MLHARDTAFAGAYYLLPCHFHRVLPTISTREFKKREGKRLGFEDVNTEMKRNSPDVTNDPWQNWLTIHAKQPSQSNCDTSSAKTSE